jgi:hypothetical protein
MEWMRLYSASRYPFGSTFIYETKEQAFNVNPACIACIEIDRVMAHVGWFPRNRFRDLMRPYPYLRCSNVLA